MRQDLVKSLVLDRHKELDPLSLEFKARDQDGNPILSEGQLARYDNLTRGSTSV